MLSDFTLFLGIGMIPKAFHLIKVIFLIFFLQSCLEIGTVSEKASLPFVSNRLRVPVDCKERSKNLIDKLWSAENTWRLKRSLNLEQLLWRLVFPSTVCWTTELRRLENVSACKLHSESRLQLQSFPTKMIYHFGGTTFFQNRIYHFSGTSF